MIADDDGDAQALIPRNLEPILQQQNPPGREIQIVENSRQYCTTFRDTAMSKRSSRFQDLAIEARTDDERIRHRSPANGALSRIRGEPVFQEIGEMPCVEANSNKRARHDEPSSTAAAAASPGSAAACQQRRRPEAANTICIALLCCLEEGFVPPTDEFIDRYVFIGIIARAYDLLASVLPVRFAVPGFFRNRVLNYRSRRRLSTGRLCSSEAADR